MYNSLSCV